MVQLVGGTQAGCTQCTVFAALCLHLGLGRGFEGLEGVAASSPRCGLTMCRLATSPQVLQAAFASCLHCAWPFLYPCSQADLHPDWVWACDLHGTVCTCLHPSCQSRHLALGPALNAPWLRLRCVRSFPNPQEGVRRWRAGVPAVVCADGSSPATPLGPAAPHPSPHPQPLLPARTLEQRVSLYGERGVTHCCLGQDIAHAASQATHFVGTVAVGEPRGRKWCLGQGGVLPFGNCLGAAGAVVEWASQRFWASWGSASDSPPPCSFWWAPFGAACALLWRAKGAHRACAQRRAAQGVCSETGCTGDGAWVAAIPVSVQDLEERMSLAVGRLVGTLHAAQAWLLPTYAPAWKTACHAFPIAQAAVVPGQPLLLIPHC